ncbi:transporter, permease [Legionella quinlivanii]|uniref:Transporter, permease n=1 Tax=Legionella quinlivanii TaxID=45073 RepID=A0A0W0XL51_9GAMM|nr:AI-2E family transporter [Legionella quinlivanii]KTD45389.1 transporter, permease [Legionella quinlivanii]SEG14274.1 Predicted PurR-regulated permease PerM [Legionella quinlivanii DSM 21216]STY10355.1 transporter, permease [Legionella quinlivanii]
MNRTVSFAAGLITVWIIGYLLIVGRSLIIPLVVAIFIWHLLNTIYVFVKKIPGVEGRVPDWLSKILAFLAVALLIKVLVDIIGNNVSDVIQASSRYQENLMAIFNKIDDYFNIKIMAKLDSFVKSLSIQEIMVNIYGVFSSVTSSAVLIILYVVFLFVEQHYFEQKLNAMIKDSNNRQLVNNILGHIVKDTQTYLGLKTLISLVTALTSWIIMKIVGLDFAEFWALLIFFLNFIPNIGAIIATLFPALLALIQFDNWLPFIIVSLGLTTIQFIIGNLIEPRFLSKSLNLSPLVILFALALWGAMWGILGMFLSVPITVMMMIIFAHFDKTRPMAIMLSQDGYIQKAYETMPEKARLL